MSQIFFDIAIWVMLFAGTGFGALAFFGLVIFPDIHSRMFTGSRAALISASLITLAACLFCANGSLAGRGDIYTVFFIHTIFLLGILLIADVCIFRIIRRKISLMETCADENEKTEKTGG